MKVKAIMKPLSTLTCATPDMTTEETVDLLEESRLYSIPVVKDNRLVGVVSQRGIFEKFFAIKGLSRDDLLKLPTSDVYESVEEINMPTIGENNFIEDAAALFIKTKFRFIPVVARDGSFLGIITQVAVFKEYQRLYGNGYDTFYIYSYDCKGTLAKISDVIAKMEGNIKNLVLSETNTMGLQEFFFRIDSKDFDGTVKLLEKKGFDVRVPEKVKTPE